MAYFPHFYFDAGTASSSDLGSYNPCSRWLDIMDELDDHQQRLTWFAPGKVRGIAPVPPARRFQKLFQGRRFPPGGSKK